MKGYAMQLNNIIRMAVYAEHATRAGQAVPAEKLDAYEGMEGRSADTCPDWDMYEGTSEQLRQLAAMIENNARPGGGGQYDRKVSRELRDATK